MATRRRAASKTMTGAVSDLQRRVRYLQAATPPSRLATQVVARTNVRPRAINSDQIELAAVTNDQVAADAIRLANMDTNSVGGTQIIDGSISNSKVDTDAIATGNLQNSSVTEDKLGNSSVTTNKIGNLAITTGKLADASVNDTKITSNAVTEDKIRNGAVGRTKIQNQAVGTGQIADRAVGTGQISDSAVGTNQLGNASITSAKIGTGAVTGAKLGGNSVTGGKVSSRTITGDKIAFGAISIQEINMDRVGPFITSEYVYPGSGISVLGGVVSANFGGGSNQIPRGNHRHSYNNSYYRQDSRGLQLQGFFSGGSQTGTASSRKFKKTISTHKTKNPKNLLDLKLKKFKYKRSFLDHQNHANKEWSYGYMIEDLLELGFDEVIYYSPSGEPERLDYGLFSTLVLELVKLQQTEIEYLKEEIKNLKEKK